VITPTIPGLRVLVARGSLVVLAVLLASGCGSTTRRDTDATLRALVTYVDAEVEVASDAGACRDELARDRSTISADTAICLAGFAQTLLERAEAVSTSAASAKGSSAGCVTSRADLAHAARATRDAWRRVIDLVRDTTTANDELSSAEMGLAIASADERADTLITVELAAFGKACLSGSEARRAEELPDRHRAAAHRTGQTI
jgi:uncharacterized protein YceK